MYIIIIGAGRVGRKLTEIILKEGHHNIIVIDKDEERCEQIARKYDAVSINADATHEETLDESEIKKADVLVTTTSDDATNLLIISLAKIRGVKQIISVVNQEESKPLYMEKGVKLIKNPYVMMAEAIYESIHYPSIEEHMHVGKNAEIIRLPVSNDSNINGKIIKKIGLPQKSLIVAIEREDRFIIPTEDAELFIGDKVTILAHKDLMEKVIKIFSG